MPATCIFTLNGQKMSTLLCPGLGAIAAFSGYGRFVNDPDATAVPDDGPLPRGVYYIVDRPKGGKHQEIVETIEDIANGTHRSQWFALFREGSPPTDYTVINGVRRGSFRLHPVGYWGRSEGCITLPHRSQFDTLRKWLTAYPPENIPGTQVRYYGMVIVR
ncbi:uncharacterized protein DUF2778 [Trinickia symbiotica]|uniref:DUF2778 domain-containing protein n=1 Tax=Trinickia symbiotica TaxID=863227 RepID=A0A2N7X8E5_9BURK|nr:DUF2778 domain-containing protein [Trinickia symbiotica]PMS38029.1 DUF2778 domain-containing protein [Trinickia symbiotica]PPK47314.1 uncharacterized protein DUF2778 [Trinickia symbiotica]